MLFESLYKTMDPTYSAPAVDTFASRLRAKLLGEVKQIVSAGVLSGAVVPRSMS